jgi:hypothetical protein
MSEQASDARETMEHHLRKAPLPDLRNTCPRPIKNWHAFNASWNPNNLEAALGLLHVGFGVSMEQGGYTEPGYTETDRLLFYLAVAHGWADNSLLHVRGEGRESYRFGRDKDYNQIRKTSSELRQMLAQKALDMLLAHFFIPAVKAKENVLEDAEIARILSPELFAAIQRFFPVYIDGENYAVRNMGSWRTPEHKQQPLHSFLIALAKLLWTWEGEESYSRKEWTEQRNREIQTGIDTAKPWMIEVLAGSRNLLVLRPFLSKLEEASLAKLREIALLTKVSRYKHPVLADRPVTSVAEAYYAGSTAAQLLVEHELMTKEYLRLQQIMEAERQRQKADETLRQLTGSPA